MNSFPITYRNSPTRSEPRPAQWEVFSADGIWFGTVEFPVGIFPAQIGADFVLAGFQSEDGIERVLKYQLIKP